MTTDDGAVLSVIDVGRGRPIVILPAWTNSASEYCGQIDELQASHRVIAVDMRGHGRSMKVESGYRIDRFAEDLRCIITQLGLRDISLMGHSMGCAVIWCYLDKFGPRDIHSLLLVDQAAAQVWQSQWSPAERLSYGCTQSTEELRDFCAKLAGPEGESLTRSMFAGLFTTKFPRDEIDWIVSEILRMPRLHAAELMLDHAPRDWRKVIGVIRIPTLVVGARRSVFPAESQLWIGQQIPGSRAIIFEKEDGGSHFMCIENPAKFNSHLRDFLVSAGGT